MPSHRICVRVLAVAIWLAAAPAPGQFLIVDEPGSNPAALPSEVQWSIVPSPPVSQTDSQVAPDLDGPYSPESWLTADATMGGYQPSVFCPACESCPRIGLYTFVDYSAFRGHPDGGWENNGIATGLNFGTRLGRFSDWTGIGFQLGASVGVYDWSGTDYRLRNQDQAEMQGFVTYGFFHKPGERSNWSWAVVQDWMLNSTFSVFGENPTLAQWRGQVGYATSPWNEYGVWATWRGQGDTRVVDGFGPVTWQPVQHVSAYWHHKWGPGGADSLIWLGVPERDRLAANGSLGDYFVGAAGNVALGERVALYTLVSYMHPSAAPGPVAAREEHWNFTIGLALYPARNARTDTVGGQCWMPHLPVANNGYFLVDASQNY